MLGYIGHPLEGIIEANLYKVFGSIFRKKWWITLREFYLSNFFNAFDKERRARINSS